MYVDIAIEKKNLYNMWPSSSQFSSEEKGKFL